MHPIIRILLEFHMSETTFRILSRIRELAGIRRIYIPLIKLVYLKNSNAIHIFQFSPHPPPGERSQQRDTGLMLTALE